MSGSAKPTTTSANVAAMPPITLDAANAVKTLFVSGIGFRVEHDIP